MEKENFNLNCIVGYSGFVGGNLLLQKTFDVFINSKNIKTIINKSFNNLYFCGLPSVKWLANKNPDDDLLIINNIIDILKTVKINRFILISTIDVYESTDLPQLNEDYKCKYESNHAYGRNRYLFEQFVITQFANYHIIRLPALFGYGLKKNILYDLLNNNQLDKINIYSKYQWYNLNNLIVDIDNILNNDIKICNLVTTPICTIDIIKLFDYDISVFDNSPCSINYNISTKYVLNNIDILNDIKIFINDYNIKKDKLCVSNICVNKISQLQFSIILQTLGIKNVEIAPTKLIQWNLLSCIDLSLFKNLNIYSFQSITYGLKELNIFDDTNNNFYNHMVSVIDCAIKYGVKILVFGCPTNRRINNTIEETKNIDNAIRLFNRLGDYCNDKSIKICIEPNSKLYNCNFINTIDEADLFVTKVNNKNISIMYDLGNAIMEKDNIDKLLLLKNKLSHVHISQEYMTNFIYPHNDNKLLSNMLKTINYTNNITLEMLSINQNNIENSLEFERNQELSTIVSSIKNFINIYG